MSSFIRLLSENISIMLSVLSVGVSIFNISTKSFSKDFQKILDTLYDNVKLTDKIVASINSSIYKEIYELISNINQDIDNKSDRKVEFTIVNILVKKEAKKESYSYFILFSTLIFYISSMFILSIEISETVIFILLILILALFIKQKILEYRIKNGYYGTNQYEAREIIDFILENSDDFDNFNGYKRIFPEIENEEITNGITDLTGNEVYE